MFNNIDNNYNYNYNDNGSDRVELLENLEKLLFLIEQNMNPIKIKKQCKCSHISKTSERIVKRGIDLNNWDLEQQRILKEKELELANIGRELLRNVLFITFFKRDVIKRYV